MVWPDDEGSCRKCHLGTKRKKVVKEEEVLRKEWGVDFEKNTMPSGLCSVSGMKGKKTKSKT